MEHIDSAHTDDDLALLKAQVQRLFNGDQMSLNLGVDTIPAGTGTTESPVTVTAERTDHLIDAINTAYRALGFDQATDSDRVFTDLFTAWIVQPGSKPDSVETALNWTKSGNINDAGH